MKRSWGKSKEAHCKFWSLHILKNFDSSSADSLPVLEHGDYMLSKPVPIARYLAFLTGLAGQDDLEQAQVDMVVENVQDFQKSKLQTFLTWCTFPEYPQKFPKRLRNIGSLQLLLQKAWLVISDYYY